MPTYLLESYGADRDDTLADARRRAMRAAEFGVDVRYLRTTFLRGEQTLLHAFQAATPDALQRAARRAELSYERIIEAVEAPFEPAITDTLPGSATRYSQITTPEGADANHQIEA